MPMNQEKKDRALELLQEALLAIGGTQVNETSIPEGCGHQPTRDMRTRTEPGNAYAWIQDTMRVLRRVVGVVPSEKVDKGIGIIRRVFSKYGLACPDRTKAGVGLRVHYEFPPK